MVKDVPSAMSRLFTQTIINIAVHQPRLAKHGAAGMLLPTCQLFVVEPGAAASLLCKSLIVFRWKSRLPMPGDEPAPAFSRSEHCLKVAVPLLCAPPPTT